MMNDRDSAINSTMAARAAACADGPSALRRIWQVLGLLYVVSVSLNYLWELLQAPLFTAKSLSTNIWFHCFVASLGDGVIVLLLFVLAWMATGRRNWFVHPRLYDYVILIVAGISLAVFIEWAAVHVFQRWAYSQSMPRIPGLEVGLVPVLQMLLLPPVIFRIMSAIALAKER
jgi:hypothetical protein